LIYDFGHDDLSVAHSGKIVHYRIVIEARRGFIGAQHIDQRHRVRRRFDTGYVEFLKLLDIFEHLIELPLKQRGLLLREVNPRQMRDIRNIDMSCFRHGFFLKN